MEIREVHGLPEYQEILPLLKAEWEQWPEGSEHKNDTEQEMVNKMTDSHLINADVTKFLIEDGQIIGFYRYTKIPRDSDDTKIAHTMDISILPGNQKRGLGSLLLKDMIDDSRSRGFESLQSRTSKANKASNALHNKIGFQMIFEKEDSYVWEISL